MVFFNTIFKYHPSSTVVSRPDTSRWQKRQMPPGHCLGALTKKCSSRNLQFPHRVPFNNDKMPWCPRPFKNAANKPESVLSSHT